MKSLSYAAKVLLRSPVRAALTVLSVAVAVFLFCVVSSMDRGLQRMLSNSSRPDVLVVFDKYQSCPPLSKLPQAHASFLETIDGIQAFTGELFVVSSCSRATDLIAVHGIEPDKFFDFREVEIAEEAREALRSERGAALVGEKAAARYGWEPGMTVSLEELNGLTFTIRGVFSTPGENLENAILVDLEFLRLATDQPGTVTFYHVRVADPESAGEVAAAIDEALASTPAPTRTARERAFLDSAVAGMSGLVEFTAALSYGVLGLILLGVGNSLSMSLRERTREIAILKIVGFRRPQVFRALLAEALLCGGVGGILGAAAAAILLALSHFSLSVEGFAFSPHLPVEFVLAAVGLSALLALAAAVVPSSGIVKRPITTALRTAD